MEWLTHSVRQSITISAKILFIDCCLSLCLSPSIIFCRNQSTSSWRGNPRWWLRHEWGMLLASCRLAVLKWTAYYHLHALMCSVPVVMRTVVFIHTMENDQRLNTWRYTLCCSLQHCKKASLTTVPSAPYIVNQLFADFLILHVCHLVVHIVCDRWWKRNNKFNDATYVSTDQHLCRHCVLLSKWYKWFTVCTNTTYLKLGQVWHWICNSK